MNPRELLQHMIEGNEVSEDTFNQFIKDHSNESQNHEFKDGTVTQKNELKKGRRTIRKYASAFANSDGGLLIIGVADNDHTISRCDNPIGQTPLDQWASCLLHDMTPYMSPLPRFQVLNHSDGPVLIVACPRSSALVPCTEEGQLRYYLRIGDSTIHAPEYLISDLVLGHRRQPILELNIDRKLSLYDIDKDRFRIVFTVENISLITSKETRLGVVSYCGNRMNPRPVNRFLRSFIDLQMPNLEPGLLVTRTRDMSFESPPLDIRPFLSTTIHLMPFRPAESYFRELYAGVFLSSENGPTVWYQITLNSNSAHTWELVRVDHGRPNIGGI